MNSFSSCSILHTFRYTAVHFQSRRNAGLSFDCLVVSIPLTHSYICRLATLERLEGPSALKCAQVSVKDSMPITGISNSCTRSYAMVSLELEVRHVIPSYMLQPLAPMNPASQGARGVFLQW